MNHRIPYKLRVFATLVRCGMLRPVSPAKTRALIDVMRSWGTCFAAGVTIAAVRYPDRPAVIDEWGTLTFAELDARTNALAHALRGVGVEDGDRVAILCRNHRGFVETTAAAAKLGVDALYLSSELPAPAIARLLERERPAVLVHDPEFEDRLDLAPSQLTRMLAFAESAATSSLTLEQAIASAPSTRLSPPARTGRMLILTSGTTGTPRTALRKPPASLRESWEPAASFISRVPLRALGRTMIAVPLHHFWGFSNFMLTLPLASACVFQRRFDAEATLRAVAEHRASTLIVVPVMLQRMLELPAATRARYDTSSLRVIAVSGSALPGELAVRTMDAFGDVLYNVYGSTETAGATVATPRELRQEPHTAGRPPLGTAVRVLDERGHGVPAGARGRIFVRSGFAFQGYSEGATREILEGFLSTGDVGHMDARGRLFVDGRDDEMIVSGAENVYPREVEDVLATHAHVREVAVLGVPDEEFGERLRAFVVPTDGHAPSEEEIKDFVRANLARYAVPRDVVFLAELPRNAAGKVLKRELRSSA